ncbi:hypothetical protein R5W23_002206 [Gemmata sp. JC673]|uniref:Uncharacterized protein n=1 Tax=Gemmata algarum TaxID=2975278 RepID=A0ABU5F2J3_9BACT|nr:hypothetical protein [Gemmata algarum]MDY3560957.1 hypothetical protein [Gemmata algarum]
MKIRHFVLDAHAQLRKFGRRAVHEVLAGRLDARAIDPALSRELALVTVVCDDNLIPERAYLLRVPLTDGVLTTADRLVLRAFVRPDCVTPSEAVQHHLTGWPRDLLPQLAVAMDVPARGLDETLEVGGPVLVAALTGRSIGSVVRGLDRT